MQVVIGGVAQGCVYGLVALGFVLIYKATETVNFAQGELMMLGAFLGLLGMTALQLPYWAASLVAIGGMMLAGLAMERVLIRPVLGQPTFSIVMLTFGLGYIARGGITMVPGIGTETHALAAPYRGMTLAIGGTVLAGEQLAIIACTSLLSVLLWACFRFTRIGLAMQASSQNQLAAYYMGVPVQHLNGLVWGLAAAVAAIAGILLAPITFVHANMGFIGLKAFPAAIVGGFASLPGAIVGGLLIGIVEALSGFFLPEGFKDVMAYVVVLIMLTLRPTGLFGERAAKKV
ncbi:branched-chain amino acid ABC transporter permease [Bradyrhizobium liaoningense]